MYYSATGTGYISTPSFAIPNTGTITVEAWMKSQLSTTMQQTIIGEGSGSTTVGYIWTHRLSNSNTFYFEYNDGTQRRESTSANFFQNLDNQWIHIVVVCDYTNKTIKSYRNGIQYGVTYNMIGTPAFPLTDRVKYIGAYSPSSYRLTDGSLDEVRIYNRGLSAEEVAVRYNSTRGRYQ